jgi:hypothetical protein
MIDSGTITDRTHALARPRGDTAGIEHDVCASNGLANDTALLCRAGCAACCIAPSISSPIPGMPHGKPAGMPCVQLDDELRCRLFGDPSRPAVCASLRPTPSMCGASREHALAYLAELEAATRPTPHAGALR